MKLFTKAFIFMLIIGVLSLCFSIVPTEAQYILVPAQGPAIITMPDYVNTFQAPAPSALPGQMFLSTDGYLFSFDSTGRRVYHMHASYILAPCGGRVHAQYIVAPMIAMHPAALYIPAPNIVSMVAMPQYILVP